MLENLERKLASDPDDFHTRLRLYQERAKINGEGEYIPLLWNLQHWIQTPHEIRVLIVDFTRALLSADFNFQGLAEWSCRVGENENSFVQKYELGCFFHINTAAQFSLIPGNGADIEPFLISRWPVTRHQYQFRNQAGLDALQKDTGYPAILGYFDDTQLDLFLKETGFRLPTVKEWLWACKAGTNTKYYWGDKFNPRHVWHVENNKESLQDEFDHWLYSFSERSSYLHLQEEKWNPFGLVDMLGNVWEKCSGGWSCGGAFCTHASTFHQNPIPVRLTDFIVPGTNPHLIGAIPYRVIHEGFRIVMPLINSSLRV